MQGLTSKWVECEDGVSFLVRPMKMHQRLALMSEAGGGAAPTALLIASMFRELVEDWKGVDMEFSKENLAHVSEYGDNRWAMRAMTIVFGAFRSSEMTETERKN